MTKPGPDLLLGEPATQPSQWVSAADTEHISTRIYQGDIESLYDGREQEVIGGSRKVHSQQRPT
jgi:hypothetical protein